MGQLTRIYKFHLGRCCYCRGLTWNPKDKPSLPDGDIHGYRLRSIGLDYVKGDVGTRLIYHASKGTREHVIRKVDGGGGGKNLWLACHYCNSQRNDRSPAENQRVMQSLVLMGLHPTNREHADVDSYVDLQAFYRACLAAHRAISKQEKS